MTDPERVLVLARDIAVPSPWLGLTRDASAIRLLEVAIGLHGTFIPRPVAEVDPGWKQIIPYVVLRDGRRWFLMRRTRAGGDARLHDRWSIGIGGHVNPGDRDVAGGLRREWSEEIQADFEPVFESVGLLNDDTDPVGAVHLGIVHVADAGRRPVAIRETDKLEGRFVEADEVLAVRDRMETWSQILVDALVAPTTAVDRSAPPGIAPSERL